MPSPNRVQLNLSLDSEIKEKLREYCDASDLSFAQAITEYVLACQKEDKLIFTGESDSIDYSTGIALDNYVTKEDLQSALSEVKDTSTNPIPDIAIEQKINKAISASCHSVIADKIQNSEYELSEYLDNRMNTAIASLREELQPLINNATQIQQLSEDDTSLEAVAKDVKKW